VLSRNPVAVGGTTAFLISLFYVSANALWYQPYAHKGAFFATRDFSRPVEDPDAASREPETTIRIERSETDVAAPPAPVRPKGDPVVEQVQDILRMLNFYDGAVDGLSGPATSRAIEAYQRKMGLTASGQIDDQLLEQLGAAPKTGAVPPAPQPRPTPSPAAPAVQPIPVPQPAATAPATERIAKIQQGLRAFGNEGINIDGVAGGQTRAAIREFQSLFGLPETGEPEEAVYRKMKEIGLMN